MVVLLNAMDFYMVKNISGRLLVGLRWWSVTSADGLTQTFRFEKTSVRICEQSVIDSIPSVFPRLIVVYSGRE